MRTNPGRKLAGDCRRKAGIRLRWLPLALLLAGTAHAERRFAEPVAIAVAPVPGAASYAWEESLGGGAWQPLGTSTGTRVIVRAPWGVPAVYRVSAVNLASRSEPSDPSDPVSWWPNPGLASGDQLKASRISLVASMFSWRLCGREWVEGTCP